MHDYLFALQNLRESLPDFVTTFFGLLSSFAVSAAPLVITALIFWSFNKHTGYLLGASITISSLIGQLMKNVLCVYRPWITDSRIKVADIAMEEATSYSCPSLHTVFSGSFLLSSAYLLRKKSKVLVILLIFMVVLIGFSRNFLGCHTLLDVLLGFVVAIFGSVLAFWVVNYAKKHPERDWLIMVIGVVASCLILIYISLKSYPLDYTATGTLLVDPVDMQFDCWKMAGGVIGLSIGYFLDHRFIHFDAKQGGTKGRILRSVFGIALMLAFYVGLMPPFKEALGLNLYYFLKYMGAVFIILIIIPWISGIVEKKYQK